MSGFPDRAVFYLVWFGFGWIRLDWIGLTLVALRLGIKEDERILGTEQKNYDASGKR